MILSKDSYFKFSAGEVHLKGHQGIGIILMRDYSMDGFMALAEVLEISKRYGVRSTKVIYPYMPYSRQDRVIESNEPFSLKIFCNLLNGLELGEVVTYDPHSDVTPALLDNVSIVPQHRIARKVIPADLLADHNVLIVSPDAGAYKKTCKLMTDDRRLVLGMKVRNKSGEIVQTRVHSSVDIKDKLCIIVDDICDGGKTFIELSKALYHQGAKAVQLYVTHGIFSKGLEPLLQAGIDRFYTTNSFNRVLDDPAVKTWNIPENFHETD